MAPMLQFSSLVMADGCQRQNWTVCCHMLRRIVLNF